MNACPYERLVGANIARARHAAGLTQQGLAAKLGVTRSALGAWEEYRSTPRLKHLMALVQLFGVTLEQFITTRLVQ